MTAPAFAALTRHLSDPNEQGQVKSAELDMVNEVFYGAMKLKRKRIYSDDDINDWIFRHTNGVYNDPKQLIERAEQLESTPDILGGATLSGLQGASLGYLDEIIGAFGGEEARDEARRQLAAFRREKPKTALASEIGGAVAGPGFAMLRGAGMAPTLGTRIATGAAIGTAEGALAMAGERDPGTHIDPETGQLEEAPDSFLENVVQRLPAAAVGAGVGAVVGAGAGALERPISKGISKLLGRTTKETPEMAAAKFAQDVADATPRGREGILADLREGQRLVPEMALGDVPEMRPVSAAAASFSEEARRVSDEFLPARERSALNRIRSQLEEAASSENNTLVARSQSTQQRMADGQSAYQALEESVDDISSPAIEDMFTRFPIMEEAWNKAQRHATRVLGEPVAPLFSEVVEEGGTTVFVRNPDAVMDFRTMQAVKRQLENLAKAAEPADAPDIWRLHREFYDESLRIVDGYGDAQRVYRELMQEKDAAELGMRFVNRKSSQVADDVAGMPANELQAYKESAAVAMLDKIDNMRRTGNIVNFFNTNAMDDKLRILLPDESSFDDFMRMIDIEEGMQETLRSQRGRASHTAEQLRQQALQVDVPAGGVERAAELAAHPAPALAGLRFLGAGRQARATRKATARAEAMGGPLQRGLLDPRFSGAENLLRGPTLPTLLDVGRMLQSPRELITAFGQGGG